MYVRSRIIKREIELAGGNLAIRSPFLNEIFRSLKLSDPPINIALLKDLAARGKLSARHTRGEAYG